MQRRSRQPDRRLVGLSRWSVLIWTVVAVMGPPAPPPGAGRRRSSRKYCEACQEHVRATDIGAGRYQCPNDNRHLITATPEPR
jgi:hypothetical protein